MNDNRNHCIKSLMTEKRDEIKAIDEAFFGDVIGVAQALGQLREALDKVDECLDRREFEKASNLGYSDVSSEFIFLQRCLGGLNETVMEKQKLIQDICLGLSSQLENIRNEEVAPLVEQEIESLKPIDKPMKLEILMGPKTAEKLDSLQNIRHTPVAHLAEAILASAMKQDEAYWRELENSKPSIPHIKDEQTEFYTCDEVSSHMKARSKQEKERRENLF